MDVLVGNLSGLRRAGAPTWTPAPASRAAPPSAAVSTQMPSSWTATECSQWEAREPSAVTTVQSSSSTSVSTARRAPPWARSPGTARTDLRAHGAGCGSSARPGARASPSRSRGRRSPRRGRTAAAVEPGGLGGDHVLDGLAEAPSRSAPPGPRSRPTWRALGGPGEATSSGGPCPPTTVSAESPCQPSTIAPQSIETTSPSRSTRPPGCRVPPRRSPRCRGGRVAVVAEEVGVAPRASMTPPRRRRALRWSRRPRPLRPPPARGDDQPGPPHEQHCSGVLTRCRGRAEHDRWCCRARSPRARRSVTSSMSPIPSTCAQEPALGVHRRRAGGLLARRPRGGGG